MVMAAVDGDSMVKDGEFYNYANLAISGGDRLSAFCHRIDQVTLNAVNGAENNCQKQLFAAAHSSAVYEVCMVEHNERMDFDVMRLVAKAVVESLDYCNYAYYSACYIIAEDVDSEKKKHMDL